jgi:hypothetical protein
MIEHKNGLRVVSETPPECDSVRWLALVLRDAFLMIVSAIEVRYGVHRKHKCSKCGWRE